MNFFLSQWGDRSKDSKKSLEPRKWSVLSTSSPSGTKSDILISFCYLWQTSWVVQRSYLLLSTLIKLGSVKKKKEKKKQPSPLFLFPQQFNYLPDSTKNPLEKNVFCICCGNLLVILSASQFKLKAQLFFSASTSRLQAALKSFQMGRVTSSYRIYKSERDLWINWNNMRKGHGGNLLDSGGLWVNCSKQWIQHYLDLTASRNKYFRRNLAQ